MFHIYNHILVSSQLALGPHALRIIDRELHLYAESKTKQNILLHQEKYILITSKVMISIQKKRLLSKEDIS